MLDTHKYYQKLREAGVEHRQAEAMTEGLAGIVLASVATKADLSELRVELKADVAKLRSEFGELRTEFGELRTEFGELRTEFGELRTEFGGLRSELGSEMNAGFRRQFIGLATVMGLFIALAQYFGEHFR